MKEVREIIDGVYKGPEQKSRVEGADGPVATDEKSAMRQIKETEKKMLECARNLDFEQAAVLRDRLEALKRLFFGADGAGSDREIVHKQK